MQGFPHLANMLREAALAEEKAQRQAEKESAKRANKRNWNVSKWAREALCRGTMQRRTGRSQ